MRKFDVTITLEVESDNIDAARTLGYDLISYGKYDAEMDSCDTASISDYSVEVDEV